MKRALRAIFRLIAAGLLVVGAMELGLEYMRHVAPPRAPINLGNCLIGAVLMALGVGLFAASRRLADRFSDDLDE